MKLEIKNLIQTYMMKQCLIIEEQMSSYKMSKHPKINSKMEEYLNPDYVYIPLPEQHSIQLDGEIKVMKNDVLFEENNKTTFSPISGVVKKIDYDLKIIETLNAQ